MIPYLSGDRMILVGDRTREEQHALIYSASIPCQVAPGNLTFTYVYRDVHIVRWFFICLSFIHLFSYWAYNNARIEVVLLETIKPKKGEDFKPYRKFLHENPYVDCGEEIKRMRERQSNIQERFLWTQIVMLRFQPERLHSILDSGWKKPYRPNWSLISQSLRYLEYSRIFHYSWQYSLFCSIVQSIEWVKRERWYWYSLSFSWSG